MADEKCTECQMPLDKGNKCSCQPDHCYHCCQCGPKCDQCGCSKKK